MQLIRKRAYARAGLIGNPSDGYNGKTISIIIRNYFAEVILYEWEQIELLGSEYDQSRFGSVQDLVRDVRQHGYYGGIRLVKATIKRFVEFCQRNRIPLHDRRFSVRYESTIPRQVGMAGSSAIIVATLRCLMEFYGVELPVEVQPSLAMSVETEELGIAAGLQDRVIQCYEGVVYMDFDKDRMVERMGLSCGKYERIDPELLPPLYVAYKDDVSEPTEVFHNDIRARYNRGEASVIQAMQRFAALAHEANEAIQNRDSAKLGQLMDANFDTRRSIYQLPAGQIEMVETARRVGASAKFAGSGGAIVGTYADESMFKRLHEQLGKIGCVVIKPRLLP